MAARGGRRRADASQRLVAARSEACETQASAHGLQVETLRLTQLAEQTRARSAQIDGDLAEVEAVVIENNVAEFVLGKAKVTEKAISFEELMGQA